MAEALLGLRPLPLVKALDWVSLHTPPCFRIPTALVDRIRLSEWWNIRIAAHVDAEKATLTERAIFEMGMNHSGESELHAPTIGVAVSILGGVAKSQQLIDDLAPPQHPFPGSTRKVIDR